MLNQNCLEIDKLHKGANQQTDVLIQTEKECKSITYCPSQEIRKNNLRKLNARVEIMKLH